MERAEAREGARVVTLIDRLRARLAESPLPEYPPDAFEMRPMGPCKAGRHPFGGCTCVDPKYRVDLGKKLSDDAPSNPIDCEEDVRYGG